MPATRSPGVRLRIDFGPGLALGPGKINLLEQIAKGGSLSRAATGLGMSYRRAWALLRDLNSEFGAPLAILSVGGAGGGGARLTPLAREVVAAYRAVERAARASARKHFAALARAAQGAPRPSVRPRAVKRARRRAARPR